MVTSNMTEVVIVKANVVKHEDRKRIKRGIKNLNLRIVTQLARVTSLQKNIFIDLCMHFKNDKQ